MKIGVVFPQTEISADPAAVRDYVQAAEGLGYSHLLAYDHVLGADTTQHANWQGSYTLESMFHEPFVLFGYLAGITTTLEMVTAVLILSQRQTALVAKQAAEVDLLTGGRLRLGVGVGWNHVEYEALGQEFGNRGRRYAEQIPLLREFWTNDMVDFAGEHHRVDHAGVCPQPVQRPIPIWMGAGARANPVPSDRVLRRVARLADGWFPQMQPGDDAKATVERLQQFLAEEGRGDAAIGMEPRVNLADGDPEFWQFQARAWQELGATHISLNTMRAGLTSPQDHIDAIQQFKEVMD
ncbi:MAG TPA: LLM class F420-dependent oxidoreductase [Dehalococcoidia bacterium]|nr:LLM class F420-dependent oxidoreductase [Chloroflexota bacterium]MQF94878.1 LLM class F420-dependent oxidoreductase [SAR202 cluster bacterium]HAA95667.1 LLM class F420-dependent oxidoreductase [Dehalococcoidia bacterium]HCL26567.1 LLM class F420-dependent oxidoreductase [Dehalococcoidia bacterium]